MHRLQSFAPAKACLCNHPEAEFCHRTAVLHVAFKKTRKVCVGQYLGTELEGDMEKRHGTGCTVLWLCEG